MPTKIISYDNLATFKSEYDAQVDRLLSEKFVVLSQAEYDALPVKNPQTIYVILDDEEDEQ